MISFSDNEQLFIEAVVLSQDATVGDIEKAFRERARAHRVGLGKLVETGNRRFSGAGVSVAVGCAPVV